METQRLAPSGRDPVPSPGDPGAGHVEAFRRFLRLETERLRMRHRLGLGGAEGAMRRIVVRAGVRVDGRRRAVPERLGGVRTPWPLCHMQARTADASVHLVDNSDSALLRSGRVTVPLSSFGVAVGEKGTRCEAHASTPRLPPQL